jgi:hypothetical protein
MVRLAKVNVPSAIIIQEDCRKLARFTKQYDGVICNFAIPYLDMNETIQLIENISRQTKTDGIFLLGFIKGEYKNSKMVRSSTGDEIFVHYYEPSFINEWIEKFRFVVLQGNGISKPESRPIRSGHFNSRQKAKRRIRWFFCLSVSKIKTPADKNRWGP